MSRRLPGLMLVLAAAVFSGGCATPVQTKPGAAGVARFFLENPQGQGTPVALPQSRVGLTLHPKPVLTEGDITNAELVQVDLGRCLMFQLTSAAARDFYRLSVTNQGRRLVLMINGVAVGARRIDGAITDGIIYVFVEMPEADLPDLVERIKATTRDVQREIRRKG